MSSLDGTVPPLSSSSSNGVGLRSSVVSPHSVGGGSSRGGGGGTRERMVHFISGIYRWLRSFRVSDELKLPLLLLALLAVFASAYFLRDIMIPFTLAVLMTYLLRPVVTIVTYTIEYLGGCCGARCCVQCQESRRRTCATCSITTWCRSTASSSNEKKEAGSSSGAGASKSPPGTAGEASLSKPPASSSPNSSSPPATASSSTPPQASEFSCSRLVAVFLVTILLLSLLCLLVLIIVDSVQAFQEEYWDTFSKQFDVVMGKAAKWIKANLHIDASSLKNLPETLTKELSSMATIMSIANVLFAALLTLLFIMFLLLDEGLDSVPALSDVRKGGEIAGADASSSGSAASASKKDAVALDMNAAATKKTDASQSVGSSSAHSETALTSSPSPSQKDAATLSSVRKLWVQVNDAVHGYILVKTFLSLIMGILVYIILGPILHVKLAHLFGLITFFLNYIPNVGAIISAIVPLPVIFLDPSLPLTNQILAVVLPLFIHILIGNVVEPLVISPVLELNAVIVLLSLGLWYVVWGVGGAILAVPLTSVITIMLKAAPKNSYAVFVVTFLEKFRIDTTFMSQGRWDEDGADDADGPSAAQQQGKRAGAQTGSPPAGSRGSRSGSSNGGSSDDDNQGGPMPRRGTATSSKKDSGSRNTAAAAAPSSTTSRGDSKASTATQGSSTASSLVGFPPVQPYALPDDLDSGEDSASSMAPFINSSGGGGSTRNDSSLSSSVSSAAAPTEIPGNSDSPGEGGTAVTGAANKSSSGNSLRQRGTAAANTLGGSSKPQ